MPIGVGYFAVSFALGIAARNAGFTAPQATVMSALISASAGQYAGIMLAAQGATYLEAAIMEMIANARYLLMSFSLGQKFDKGTPLLHRMVVANWITDEIFALSVSVPGKLNPFYTYGIVSVAAPGWTIGTCLGVVVGNILPVRVVSALSVGLFGMFLAIIIPPARHSRILAGLIAFSMFASWLFQTFSLTARIAPGIRTILLTALISLGAAILFPHQEQEEETDA